MATFMLRTCDGCGGRFPENIMEYLVSEMTAKCPACAAGKPPQPRKFPLRRMEVDTPPVVLRAILEFYADPQNWGDGSGITSIGEDMGTRARIALGITECQCPFCSGSGRDFGMKIPCPNCKGTGIWTSEHYWRQRMQAAAG